MRQIATAIVYSNGNIVLKTPHKKTVRQVESLFKAEWLCRMMKYALDIVWGG